MLLWWAGGGTLKNGQTRLKFCQSGEILPNLVTLAGWIVQELHWSKCYITPVIELTTSWLWIFCLNQHSFFNLASSLVSATRDGGSFVSNQRPVTNPFRYQLTIVIYDYWNMPIRKLPRYIITLKWWHQVFIRLATGFYSEGVIITNILSHDSIQSFLYLSGRHRKIIKFSIP